MKWWPFRKKEKVKYVNPNEIGFTQVDITETFDDHLTLSKEDWIETVSLNSFASGPPGNLPPADASEDEVYRIASDLSKIRETLNLPDDGVYCPVCHIANVDIENLRTPCPKCGRPLLAFGWT